MNTIKVIISAYIGVAGSGKEYTSDIECAKTFSFADEIREMLWVALGWRPENPEAYRDFKNHKFTFPDGSSFFGRDFMGSFGTDLMRKYRHDNDIWVKCTQAKITEWINQNQHSFFPEGTVRVGIQDVREPHEIQALIDMEDDPSGKYTVVFRHCDYHSPEYNAKINLPTEKVAQKFVGLKFRKGEFDKHIRSYDWRNPNVLETIKNPSTL